MIRQPTAFPDPALLNALYPMGEEIVTVDAARAFSLTPGQLLQRDYTVQTLWTLLKRYQDSIMPSSIQFVSIASHRLSMSNTRPNWKPSGIQ
jgi:hypothetical protein